MRKQRHIASILCVLSSFSLLGCFDRDCAVEVKNVRSESGFIVQLPDYDLTWEFRIQNQKNGNLSCRPGNLLSDVGLNYWTTLYPVGQINDFKVLSGLRGGHEITLIVRESGKAFLIEHTLADRLVHEFPYASKVSLKKDGHGNLTQCEVPVGSTFYFAKIYAEN